jgi:SAM-dependent methyltransferase
MNMSQLHALLTPEGQQALQAAMLLKPREVDYLRYFQELSRKFPPDLAQPALEAAILRSEASTKFPFARQLYLVREALEQASAWAVAEYRARRYAPFGTLLDLGCSIGGDTIALAQVAPTIGVDRDALRLALARANLTALGLADRITLLQADLANPLPFRLPRHTAVFFDPARRSQGRRVYSVRNYRPALSVLKDWLAHTPAIGVKISPGVDLRELAEYPAEVEFITLDGELKEAVLWFGPLETVPRRATILPGPHSLVPAPVEGLALREPGAFIYEPDPSVLRAGLVQVLGASLGADQLDEDIAYLTADEYRPTPFARAWAVEGWFPFGLKKLRAFLRQRNVGRLTVKKRGSPLQPEALIRELRLSGDAERVVFLTHLRGRPIAVIAFPYQLGVASQ